MDDPVKWALLDLLKLLDLIHDGEWHEEFQRIASTLGIELPAVDRKSTRLNSSHSGESRMPSSA